MFIYLPWLTFLYYYYGFLCKFLDSFYISGNIQNFLLKNSLTITGIGKVNYVKAHTRMQAFSNKKWR